MNFMTSTEYHVIASVNLPDRLDQFEQFHWVHSLPMAAGQTSADVTLPAFVDSVLRVLRSREVRDLRKLSVCQLHTRDRAQVPDWLRSGPALFFDDGGPCAALRDRHVQSRRRFTWLQGR